MFAVLVNTIVEEVTQFEVSSCETLLYNAWERVPLRETMEQNFIHDLYNLTIKMF